MSPGQVGLRVLGRMIRMRMIEADDIQAVATSQPLCRDYLKRIEAIVPQWFRVGIIARIDRTYGSAVGLHITK
jgi:hypothetical protein